MLASQPQIGLGLVERVRRGLARKARTYLNLGDVLWCATEDGSTRKGTGRHIAAFILYPANAGKGGA